MKRFSRPILVLCFVSLFNDISSEMLFPVVPIYLTTVLGASMVLVGLIEGLGEAMAGLSKGYFGAMSDERGKRAPFVVAGYALSALAKPLPGIFRSVFSVLFSRVSDRMGKGIRTAPRDALLAEYATTTNRGAVFGLHRAMDTFGAALGPAIALGYLALYPNDYRSLFLFAFIPSVLAVGLTFVVKDKPFTPQKKGSTFAASLSFWSKAPATYKKLFLLLTLFAFANASDVFLIMRSRSIGFSDTAAIGGYIVFNLIYALTSLPLGQLSDTLGRKRVVVGGLGLYALTYIGFALSTSEVMCWVLFGLYGIYYAATEGVAKAWIADLIPNAERGRAMGLFTGATSIAALAASIIAGLMWENISHQAPFFYSAIVAVYVAVALAMFEEKAAKDE